MTALKKTISCPEQVAYRIDNERCASTKTSAVLAADGRAIVGKAVLVPMAGHHGFAAIAHGGTMAVGAAVRLVHVPAAGAVLRARAPVFNRIAACRCRLGERRSQESEKQDEAKAKERHIGNLGQNAIGLQAASRDGRPLQADGRSISRGLPLSSFDLDEAAERAQMRRYGAGKMITGAEILQDKIHPSAAFGILGLVDGIAASDRTDVATGVYEPGDQCGDVFYICAWRIAVHHDPDLFGVYPGQPGGAAPTQKIRPMC